MAQDSDKPTSADKGKGKAPENANDDKPVVNGKKDEGKKDGKQESTIPITDEC